MLNAAIVNGLSATNTNANFHPFKNQSYSEKKIDFFLFVDFTRNKSKDKTTKDSTN